MLAKTDNAGTKSTVLDSKSLFSFPYRSRLNRTRSQGLLERRQARRQYVCSDQPVFRLSVTNPDTAALQWRTGRGIDSDAAQACQSFILNQHVSLLGAWLLEDWLADRLVSSLLAGSRRVPKDGFTSQR